MNQPSFWFINPMELAGPIVLEQMLAAIRAEKTAAAPQPIPLARRPSHDGYGAELPAMRMQDSVAIIPVKGVLLQNAHPVLKKYGAVGYEDVREDLQSARAQNARAVVLDISSPGGQAVGAGELAADVADFARHTPVVSFTDSMQCSAAEYLSGACTARYATEGAIVGSIGTVMTTISIEGLLKDLGVKANIFASGPFKAAGHPFKDLTPEQTDYLQSFVDNLANEFKSHMLNYRAGAGLAETSMQGQVFTGKQGARNGLVDANARNLDEAVRLAMRLEFPLTGGRPPQ